MVSSKCYTSIRLDVRKENDFSDTTRCLHKNASAKWRSKHVLISFLAITIITIIIIIII
jgi:hypothetical protein